MKNKRIKFQDPIKKLMLVVVIAGIITITALIYLQLLNRQREYEDKLIINVFGEQKMYTQMISNDVSRIYLILQALDTGNINYSIESTDHKLEELKVDLMKARKEFSVNLEAIHDKKLTYHSDTVTIEDSIISNSTSLKKIDRLWKELEPSIDIVTSSNRNEDKLAKAVYYIQNNNIKLLAYHDKLQEQILNDSLQDDKARQFIAVGIISILGLGMIFFIYQIQKYLVQPMSLFYKGIAEIGLDSYQPKPSLPTKKKIIPIVTEINEMFSNINNLKSLMENMNNNMTFVETLDFISRTFASYIPYNYIGIALISEDKKYLKASYGVSDGSINGLTEKIKGFSWLITETSLDALIESGEARIINDLEEYCKGKPLKSYNKAILDAGIRASITLPLNVSGEPVGVIFFSSAHKNVYMTEHLNFLKTLANSIAISLNQSIFVSDVVYSSILALAKLAEARDDDSKEHLDHISVYARIITELLYEHHLYLDEINLEYIDNIERFSPLHDIGKVGIRDDILLKPAKLTTEEFSEMKKHAAFGAEVLRSAEINLQKRGKSLFGMGVEIAEGHHEKWDGSGYPYGKKGTEIPLCARIAALADVFDALTSKRPYKEAFSIEQTYEIIQEGREKHFDPTIVDILFENPQRIEHAYHKFQRHG